ncbi:hypothetical protein FPV67DRAFT_1484626 [Lyophyllum atratum]|nr:hypothetical protein FPV67DRAFT_1484626 [Lyophyllum atratum]
MLCRERRSWTAKEDQLLRDAVEREDPDNPNPSKWHAIAKHVPNRTNKDCRKRWFAKMASDVVKGGWAPDEDEKLVQGIERYGTRWSLVASVVQSRNSDQCAKRWTDTLNPAIDRTTWTSEADELLLRAVNEHGKVWTKIVKTYFPGRTGLSAKNRYNSITRFNIDHSRGTRSRRKTPELLPYLSHRKSESVSSSSSSVSPSTPSIPIPDGLHSPFSSAIDSVSESYLFDSLSSWSQSPSPSETAHDGMTFYSSPNVFGVKEENIMTGSLLSLPSSMNPSHQSFDSHLNPAIASFADDSHLAYTASHPPPQGPPRSNTNLYNMMSNDLYTSYPQQYTGSYPNHAVGNQVSLFDALPTQGNGQMGMNWDGANFDTSRQDRSKMMGASFIF